MAAATPPKISKDAMYQLLRDGKIDQFNALRAKGKDCNLIDCDFRAVDLQGLDAEGLDFSGCYFRLADLRGVDFSRAIMESASIHDAKISGAYFPAELTAEEITMSMIRGTRMRYGQ